MMNHDDVALDGKDFVPGRLVRYVDLNGKYYPMIIVNARKDFQGANHRADGVAFGEFGALYVGDVLYDQGRGRGTWHWPIQRKPSTPKPQSRKPQPGKPLYVPKKGKERT